MGRNNKTKMLKHFNKNGINSDQYILQLIKTMAMLQAWINHNKIKL
jgi:hypothetical protein